jgi:hypothetical protein
MQLVIDPLQTDELWSSRDEAATRRGFRKLSGLRRVDRLSEVNDFLKLSGL